MKDDRLVLRIDETEKQALKKMADKLDISMSLLVRQAVKEFIQKHSKEN